MRNFLFQLFVFLGLTFLVFLSFSTLMPLIQSSNKQSDSKFSAKLAFDHVQTLAQKPHFTGSDNHSQVRNYIVEQLQDLGLDVHTQNGFVINKNNILTNPVNIVGILKGSDPTPKSDLLVMAHYDSDPHSSLGAADDASGIAAILESLRVFQNTKDSQKNNIIVLITDAEEIGLLGAQLFAEQHPLAENIGLVLNFEARGTSGPSNAILETNYGNKELVKSLADAGSLFPVTSSLMYEIYKTMPNDTDATVFREEKDIPGFFFAFIDGHYNYHAATDTPENLNLNSLAHQGSYLTALLPHYANIDLSSLKSARNRVFFNFPFFKIVHYDYYWIFPLLILGWVGLCFIVGIGFRKRVFEKNDFIKALFSTLLGLGISAAIGFFGWKLIAFLYPQYWEIQQGFPYNGHLYIASFIAFSTAVLFLINHYFIKITSKMSLLVVPLILWLLICSFLSFTFKGASFFIVPVLFFEMILFLMLWKNNINPFIRLLLSIPAIFIISPLVLFIPVALNMNLVFLGIVVFVLLYFLLTPVFIDFKSKNWLSLLAFGLGIFFVINAHGISEFSDERPKPNSLIYFLDKEKNTAQWRTYDRIFDEWNQPFFTEGKEVKQAQGFASKYGRSYTYTQKAPVKEIPEAGIQMKKDSLDDAMLSYIIKISSNRKVNRIDLFSDQKEDFKNLKINRISVENLSENSSKIKASPARNNRFLTYYKADNDTLLLEFSLPKNIRAEIELYETAYDLLDNPWLEIPDRNKNMIPKPFVINDAIITRQVICL